MPPSNAPLRRSRARPSPYLVVLEPELGLDASLGWIDSALRAPELRPLDEMVLAEVGGAVMLPEDGVAVLCSADLVSRNVGPVLPSEAIEAMPLVWALALPPITNEAATARTRIGFIALPILSWSMRRH